MLTTVGSPVINEFIRESRIRHFGQIITSFDWSEIYGLSDVNEKYNRFNETVSAMIECYFPNKQTNKRQSLR